MLHGPKLLHAPVPSFSRLRRRRWRHVRRGTARPANGHGHGGTHSGREGLKRVVVVSRRRVIHLHGVSRDLARAAHVHAMGVVRPDSRLLLTRRKPLIGLLEVLLNPRTPVVLDLVVRPSWQMLRYLRPPDHDPCMYIYV
ncbi:unnamed protein product [Linum trigynum]|uniref:Uncharacterized protein n=1 Tax=Linum trigynum TaxID=586398 RepID=A0AAV2CR00_9ROSI